MTRVALIHAVPAAMQPVEDAFSSDADSLCIDGPAFDLLTTMSKFFCLGMKLEDVVRAATEAPAMALRRSDLGSLRPRRLPMLVLSQAQREGVLRTDFRDFFRSARSQASKN